jgi:hypothetical protein
MRRLISLSCFPTIHSVYHALSTRVNLTVRLAIVAGIHGADLDAILTKRQLNLLPLVTGVTGVERVGEPACSSLFLMGSPQ